MNPHVFLASMALLALIIGVVYGCIKAGYLRTQTFTPVDKKMPPLGIPVIGFCPLWIDEDFNPSGMRECFRTASEGPDGHWVISAYCNHHDEWHTGYDKDIFFNTGQPDHIYPAPTHWAFYPKSPKTSKTPPHGQLEPEHICD